jgi:hypothetical protein
VRTPIVRWILIEMVWRLVRWQPDYAPIRQFVKGLIVKHTLGESIPFVGGQHKQSPSTKMRQLKTNLLEPIAVRHKLS